MSIRALNEKLSLLKRFQYGCTGISWFFKNPLPEHFCCEEHDLAYDQGGSLLFKLQMDKKLVDCIFKKNGSGLIGFIKAIGAWLVVTVNPYAYIVWERPEGYKG